MRYAVDPAAVLAEAAALERVRAALAVISHPAAGSGADWAGALGSGSLARALQDATGNWSHARARVDGELHGLARAAAVAATAYDAAEGGVLRAVCGGRG